MMDRQILSKAPAVTKHTPDTLLIRQLTDEVEPILLLTGHIFHGVIHLSNIEDPLECRSPLEGLHREC